MENKLFSYLRVDSRGVNPETGQRYAPPFWERERKISPALSIVAAASWPVVGVDVSKYQGAMNWNTALSRGISFAIIRSSYYYGGLNEDPQYRRNCDECDRLQIPYGVYHYIIPAGNAVTQANYFIDRYRGNLSMAMDVEDRGGLGSSALSDWLQAFADTIESQIGKKPIIYTRQTFFDPYVAPRHWGDYKLWIARYDSTLANPYPPYTPRDWPGLRDWTFWQWSAGGNGMGSYYGAQSSDIDLNRYDGTLAEFKAEFGLTDGEPQDEIIYIPAGKWEIELQADVIIRKRKD